MRGAGHKSPNAPRAGLPRSERGSSTSSGFGADRGPHCHSSSGSSRSRLDRLLRMSFLGSHRALVGRRRRCYCGSPQQHLARPDASAAPLNSSGPIDGPPLCRREADHEVLALRDPWRELRASHLRLSRPPLLRRHPARLAVVDARGLLLSSSKAACYPTDRLGSEEQPVTIFEITEIARPTWSRPSSSPRRSIAGHHHPPKLAVATHDEPISRSSKFARRRWPQDRHTRRASSAIRGDPGREREAEQARRSAPPNVLCFNSVNL